MKLPKINDVVKSMLVSIAGIDAARRFLSRRIDGLATVFLLHRAAGVYTGINGHDPAELERVLIELKKRGFNIVSLEQVVDAARGQGNLPGGSVAFTVDDGYRDQFEVIAPIFVKHQVPLTIFLATGLINDELWPWDAKIHWLISQAGKTCLEVRIGQHCLEWPLGSQLERLSTRRQLQAIAAGLPVENIDDFLITLEAAVEVKIPEVPPPEFSPGSWDEVRRLEDAGVRFAPHTHSHRILSRLSEDEVRSELSRSLETVMAETRFGLPVLAYPVGMEQHLGLREMHLAESMGFSAAFAVCADYARWGESRISADLRYRLGRFGLPHSTPEMLWLATGLQAMREHFSDFIQDQSGN